MGDKNIVWINNIRAICILAVYFVHVEINYGYEHDFFDALLHPFYVNAFFFVSGYLMLRKQLSDPIINQKAIEYIMGGGKILGSNILYRIIIPSVIFSTIEYLPAVILRGGSVSFTEMLYKTVGGGTYWFTSALVVAQLLFLLLLLSRIHNVWFYSVISIVVGIAATYFITNDIWITGRNWWAYKQGTISMIFLALGGIYWRYEQHINKLLNWFVMLPLLAVYTYIVGWHYDITECVISTLHLNALGIVISVLICFMLPRMLRNFKPVESITYIGMHSICFYLMSGALPIIISMIIKHILGVNAIGYTITLIACLSLAYLVTCIINRWLPWLLDLRVICKKIK